MTAPMNYRQVVCPAVMSVSRCSLLVRHLPAGLEDREKMELLQHFGANTVKLMGTTGPMKHTAFALFESAETAERCLKTLHQIELLGCRLSLEYARTEAETELQVTATSKKAVDTKQAVEEPAKPDKVAASVDDDKVFRKHGLNYPRKTNLQYLYPPPTASTLTNIGNALASNPKLYTQVLHLMNKMNLPCPFGAVTAIPPLALDAASAVNDGRKTAHGVEIKAEDIDECEMEHSSTEESEIESDSEANLQKTVDSLKQTKKALKRPKKRMRLVEPDVSMVTKPVTSVKPSEVFESADALKPTQIVFNLSGAEAVTQDKRSGEASGAETSNVTVVEGGFGLVTPQAKPQETNEIVKENLNYKVEPKEFLPTEKINSGRLKPDQMREFSVFKNYSAGEPTSRLYIKNLTKQSTEQDLVNLFGPYIDWSVERVTDVFDIRLMKEGRMKGQAFVTLPDEHSAKKIVSECTGYIMHGKPVVIQFARSAKAKEVKELIK